MEFRTAEEKLLHDYDVLEEENMRLHDENAYLKDRIVKLEKGIAEAGKRAKAIEVERDHHADCVKDILATAAFYGFEQPTRIEYNPAAGTMRPAAAEGTDGKCAIHHAQDEGLA